MLVVLAFVVTTAPLTVYGQESDPERRIDSERVPENEPSSADERQRREASRAERDVVDANGNDDTSELNPSEGISVTLDPLMFALTPFLNFDRSVTALPGLSAGAEFQISEVVSVRPHASWLHMRFSGYGRDGPTDLFELGVQPRVYFDGSSQQGIFAAVDVSAANGALLRQFRNAFYSADAYDDLTTPVFRVSPGIGAKKVWPSGFTIGGDVGFTATYADRSPVEDEFHVGNWIFTERYTMRLGWSF